jgi:alpha-glucoside transport system permease protein
MIAESKAPTSISARLVQLTSRGVLHVILVGLGLIWLVPSLGLFITSWRSRADIAAAGWWTALLQWKYTTGNYAEVLTARGFTDNFTNSFIITIPATVLPILIGALAGYAFAWLQFRWRDALFLLVVALLVVPLQTTWVPVLRMFNVFKLTGNFVGIWLAHTAYGLPFAIFLFRNFFAELPKELFESAKIDGASDLGIFFRIVVPLSVPAIASLAIFQFVWVWNDLMNALIFLQDPGKYPLTVAIQNLLGQYGSEWHLLAAGAFVTMSMPLVVFFALQRYFVHGITAGAIKG